MIQVPVAGSRPMHSGAVQNGLSQNGVAQNGAAQNGAALRSFAALLWRRRLVLGLVVVLVALTVSIGLATAEREYTATARVAVTPAPGQAQTGVDHQAVLSTVADVATSGPVLGEVQEQIGNRRLSTLRRHVASGVVTGTVLVQVRVTDTNPQTAAAAANAVVAALPEHVPGRESLVFDTTDPARVPSSFSSPNLKVSALAAVLLAGALGVAAAVVVDRVARTVETPEEAVDTAGVGVLGVIPAPRRADALLVDQPDGPEAAALRALRVALEFASSEEPTRTLVVAPVVPDPWSGWLETRLAVALAEVGHRVLVVDANRDDRQRHPALDAPEAPGLYDMLADGLPLSQVAMPGPVEKVSIVPLGNPDLAAPSLLEMRIRGLLEGLDDAYDVILVHAPAVTESDDARILALDGALVLTVPSGRVNQSVLTQAMRQLHAVRIRVLGTVLLGGRARRRRRARGRR